MKKKKIIVITVLAVIAIAIILCVGGWFLTRDNSSVMGSDLETLEEDPGNTADDSWTARY